MGLACPVCDEPQADATHLANHLAFSALTGADDHEAWLDEHVPDWGSMGEADLAPIVADHADEREFPQVFEDTTGSTGDGGHGHDHGDGDGTGHEQGDTGPADPAVDPRARSPADDPEAAAVVEEARELTREMHERAESEDDEEDAADGADGSSADDETPDRGETE